MYAYRCNFYLQCKTSVVKDKYDRNFYFVQFTTYVECRYVLVFIFI